MRTFSPFLRASTASASEGSSFRLETVLERVGARAPVEAPRAGGHDDGPRVRPVQGRLRPVDEGRHDTPGRLGRGLGSFLFAIVFAAVEPVKYALELR